MKLLLSSSYQLRVITFLRRPLEVNSGSLSDAKVSGRSQSIRLRVLKPLHLGHFVIQRMKTPVKSRGDGTSAKVLQRLIYRTTSNDSVEDRKSTDEALVGRELRNARAQMCQNYLTEDFSKYTLYAQIRD
ncbi:hypothetical protein CLF_112308 [Clonorchis sinensis]|uniref:Uncharacterized protein n=1 Tax=Clonorchis sinensis TaxID=79923 RepID=G7YW61_CLOSI|nr:hypothetical protein CLF_112308 [Clonorchis sinensis]